MHIQGQQNVKIKIPFHHLALRILRIYTDVMEKSCEQRLITKEHIATQYAIILQKARFPYQHVIAIFPYN